MYQAVKYFTIITPRYRETHEYRTNEVSRMFYFHIWQKQITISYNDHALWRLFCTLAAPLQPITDCLPQQYSKSARAASLLIRGAKRSRMISFSVLWNIRPAFCWILFELHILLSPNISLASISWFCNWLSPFHIGSTSTACNGQLHLRVRIISKKAIFKEFQTIRNKDKSIKILHASIKHLYDLSLYNCDAIMYEVRIRSFCFCQFSSSVYIRHHFRPFRMKAPFCGLHFTHWRFPKEVSSSFHSSLKRRLHEVYKMLMWDAVYSSQHSKY